MFNAFFSRHHGARQAATALPVALPAASAPSPDVARAKAARAVAEGVLARWHLLGETQRRAFEAVCMEINDASTEVEDSVVSLMRSFNGLTKGAQAQTRQLEQTIRLIDTIDAGEKSVGIGEFVAFMGHALGDLVERTLLISKTAMTMVYSLDDAATNLARVETCVVDIEQVNHRARMLSLNATIEAGRAGEAGRGFNVVAGEVRDLSHSTEALAKKMRSEIGVIGRALSASRELLATVVTVDMTGSLETKGQLDAMLGGLEERRRAMATVVHEMTESSAEMNTFINAITTEVQFQESNRKRMQDVVQTLRLLTDATQEALEASTACVPAGTGGAPDEGCIERILEHCQMDDVRHRFAAWLRTGAAAPSEVPGVVNAIELF